MPKPGAFGQCHDAPPSLERARASPAHSHNVLPPLAIATAPGCGAAVAKHPLVVAAPLPESSDETETPAHPSMSPAAVAYPLAKAVTATAPGTASGAPQPAPAFDVRYTV